MSGAPHFSSWWRRLLWLYPLMPALAAFALLAWGTGRHHSNVVFAVWMSLVWIVICTALVLAIFDEYRLLDDRIERLSLRGRHSILYSDVTGVETGIGLAGRTRSPSLYVEIRARNGAQWRIHTWMLRRGRLGALLAALGQRLPGGVALQVEAAPARHGSG